MSSSVNTLTFSGIRINEVKVQTSIVPGLFKIVIVGLPDKIIAEAKERVQAALHAIGISIPSRKVLINLSPANLIKEGSHFDLPIAVSMLTKLGILPEHELQKFLIMGELALNGDILSVPGVLPAAVGATNSDLGIICPEKNGPEAAWSGNSSILAPGNLLSLINHFKGSQQLSTPPKHSTHQTNRHTKDFSDVIGQEFAKRAFEIAAAGHHNVLLVGSPGAGKSMLSQSLPSILPAMSATEILETSMLYSIAGEIKNGQLQYTRPFRSPHHSASVPAMVGGGHSKRITPGEISLSHNGVLFMDEFPEFPRVVLDALRQPMEAGKISIARAEAHIEYPANFQLIAAMNHCRCGNFKNAKKMCARAPICVRDYMNKVPGPILDRIDMFVEVEDTVSYGTTSVAKSESSSDILKRVEAARKIQSIRLANYGIRTNSQLDGKLLQKFATPSSDGQALLEKFANKHRLSMRSYNRLLRVGRTIADLAAQEQIEKSDVAEAINYREYCL